MRLFKAVFFVGVILGSMTAIAQGPRRDGRWEVSMQMEMTGVPMQLPPQTIVQCITPEQAAKPEQSVPQAGRGQNPNDCKVSDYKVDGNKVTWTMTCQGRESMTAVGEMVYAGDTYRGTMKVDSGGRNMTMN